MMLSQVRTITHNTFYFLDSINNNRMSPFPVFLALGSTRVHIYILNHDTVVANAEAMIDEPFSINATLWIIYIKSDDSHVWLQRYLDDSGT